MTKVDSTAYALSPAPIRDWDHRRQTTRTPSVDRRVQLTKTTKGYRVTNANNVKSNRHPEATKRLGLPEPLKNTTERERPKSGMPPSTEVDSTVEELLARNRPVLPASMLKPRDATAERTRQKCADRSTREGRGNLTTAGLSFWHAGTRWA